MVMAHDHNPDLDLDAEQLNIKYNRHGGGEHPTFTRSNWRDAVENEDTLTGYWVWVVSELERASDETDEDEG
jgi:hypothetical protein